MPSADLDSLPLYSRHVHKTEHLLRLERNYFLHLEVQLMLRDFPDFPVGWNWLDIES